MQIHEDSKVQHTSSNGLQRPACDTCFRVTGFADYSVTEKAGTLKADGGDAGGGSENLILVNVPNARMRSSVKAEWSAGFCYLMGAKAKGIGYQEEMAPCLSRRLDAVLIKLAHQQKTGHLQRYACDGKRESMVHQERSDSSTLLTRESECAEHDERYTESVDTEEECGVFGTKRRRQRP